MPSLGTTDFKPPIAFNLSNWVFNVFSTFGSLDFFTFPIADFKSLRICWAALAGLDLGKDDGGLESLGYVYIGDEPDSVDDIDVEGEDGKIENTTIKWIAENNEGVI
jgi:hypothetical protein